MSPPDARKAFRLDLEAQRERAGDLFRAAGRGDPGAVARITQSLGRADGAPGTVPDAFTLADARRVIARELGLDGWPELTEHIAVMERERAVMERERAPMDGGAPGHGPKTLHIRCGSDLAQGLRQGGFTGDYLEYANPFCQGPVTGEPGEPGEMRRRVRFLAESYGEALGLSALQFEKMLRQEENGLASSYRDYERVVLWFEHDSFDQLILIRCLAFFATHRPAALELVSANRFPGTSRFLGLGQLPPEALRLLWTKRSPVSEEQLALGRKAWDALKSPDPTELASIANDESAVLPDLPTALRRHLQELPSVRNGLGLTQELVLSALAEREQTIGDLFQGLLAGREPLPWLGDVMFLSILEAMRMAQEPPFEISPETASGPWPCRLLTITSAGFRTLSGDRDWLTRMPPERWVGGVCIEPQAGTWRWNEDEGRPVFV